MVAWSSAGDVVAGFVETAELFDVDVDQLAGMAAAIPIRFNTVVTVDNAMSSFSAICGPVMRSWRNCSMSASVSADVCVGDVHGRDDRSVIGSPASKRANHFWTVRSLHPAAPAASATFQPCSRTRAHINSR